MARFPLRTDGRRPFRYRLVVAFLRLVLRGYYGRKIHIEGREKIPDEGPLLVVSNHLSLLDPLILGTFFPKTLFAMAKRQLFQIGVMRWVLRGCNVFPVNRGAPDRRAIQLAIEILTRFRGRLLIFVEGTRARSPGMLPAEPGVGFLQRRSGAPILPVAIWGSERALVRGGKWPRRVDIHVKFGDVFSLPQAAGHGDDLSVAETVAAAVAALLPAEYRGAYAGVVANGQRPSMGERRD